MLARSDYNTGIADVASDWWPFMETSTLPASGDGVTQLNGHGAIDYDCRA